MNKLPFKITSPTLEQSGDNCKVSVQAGGHSLWFQCCDAELRPHPEAFLTAFFIPALHTRSEIEIDDNIHPGWVDNTKKLLPIFHRWWNYPLQHPLGNFSGYKEPNPLIANEAQYGSSSALCFTAGVDSFYSLLCGSEEVKYLFYIYGFDIPLDDAVRFKDFEHTLHRVADMMDVTPIVIKTNMREHPFFKRVSWKRTHGAALAAAALVLTEKFNNLIIPSSDTYHQNVPWGSHWETDPLWSVPNRLNVIHGDTYISRRDKIIDIADEPVVQHYLRVCWQNIAETGNCSTCEKCLRTMITLEASGQLSNYYRVFDVQTSLAQLLNKLEYIPQHLTFSWNDLVSRNISESTGNAIRLLQQRSKHVYRKNRLKRWYRCLKRAIKSGMKKVSLFFSTADET